MLIKYFVVDIFPDSKVHEANMGPIWGRHDPGGPHIGPMKFAIWVIRWKGFTYLFLYDKQQMYIQGTN